MDDNLLKYLVIIGAALASSAVIGLFLVVLRLILLIDNEVMIMGITISRM